MSEATTSNRTRQVVNTQDIRAGDMVCVGNSFWIYAKEVKKGNGVFAGQVRIEHADGFTCVSEYGQIVVLRVTTRD